METIHIQGLIFAAKDIPGESIAATTYSICGQGADSRNAASSAESCIVNHLSAYAEQGVELPRPDALLLSLDRVRNYFSDYIPKGSTIRESHTHRRPPERGLPELVFEFYEVD